MGSLLRRHAVALLALVLALSGGAYAAARIGSKQIKRDAIKTRHLARGAVHNPDLAPGVKARIRAAVGPTGPRGPKGSRGPTGSRGARGPTGPSGAAPKTLRGVWAVSGATGAEDGQSFVFGLADAPTPHVVMVGQPEPACTGTVGSPTAATGALCVYVAGASTAGIEVFTPSASGGKFGFGVRLTADGRASGTWAVSAP